MNYDEDTNEKKDLFIERNSTQGSEFDQHFVIISNLPREEGKQNFNITDSDKDILIGTQSNSDSKLTCGIHDHLPSKKEIDPHKILETGQIVNYETKIGEEDKNKNFNASSRTPSHLSLNTQNENKTIREWSHTEEFPSKEPITTKKTEWNHNTESDYSNRLHGDGHKAPQKNNCLIPQNHNKNIEKEFTESYNSLIVLETNRNNSLISPNNK